MIGVSKLYLGTVEPSDALRYERRSKRLPSHLLQFSADKKPVVVWNVTRACNLHCLHCYAHSDGRRAPDELSTAEGRAVIDDLVAFGAPVLLFSGGEPLCRRDINALIEYAVGRGMRAVLSTNGTMIDATAAKRLKTLGVSYVGISIDGIGGIHDRFRGQAGAYEATLAGIRACREAGVKVGLRFTVCRDNRDQVPGIFELMLRERIPRLCIYHLAYSGRGSDLIDRDLNHLQTRKLVDAIIDKTAELHAKGWPAEVLTVGNHCDGPYLYLRMCREEQTRAEDVIELLRMNGGNSSGHGIGCISWDGTVYPDQFWRNRSLGNVRDTPFSQIWTDVDNEFLMKLKNKRNYVTGRCANCRFLEVCGGNLRSRAEAALDDMWAPDPACYLTDEEVAAR